MLSFPPPNIAILFFLSLPELKFSDTQNGKNKPLANYRSSIQRDGTFLRFNALKLFRARLKIFNTIGKEVVKFRGVYSFF